MMPEKFLEVLTYEGVASIVTQGHGEPHLVCTWNSYIQVLDNGKLLYPAGGMNATEVNLEKNNKIQMAVGSKEVDGFHGPGTGFRIEGTAAFIKSGPEFEVINQKFPCSRAAFEITVDSITQTL
ncbi:MAG: pyridoxamine 5'-phosphate oxidase family protein [Bacillota bacterium]|nr:pyridoxamine 5'-phosphate oxidase family protein [Bacillota bacterium]